MSDSLTPTNPVANTTLALPDGWFELVGFGTVLQVDGDEVVPYFVTASTCTVGDADDNAFQVDHAEADDEGHIIFDLVGPATDFRLRPLADGPDCPSPASDTVQALDELFATHYPFFDERGLVWREEIATIRSATLVDPDQFEHALTSFMVALGDSHTATEAIDIDPDIAAFGVDGVETRQDAEALLARELEKTLGQLTDIQTDRSGMITWGRISPGSHPAGSAASVGYLAIAGFEGFAGEDTVGERDSFVAVLDEAVRDLESWSDSVIIDMRFNTGGYDDLAVIAAGYFVEEVSPGLRKWPYGEAEPVRQTIDVLPQASHFSGDIVVLTSPITASAAEVFTLAVVEVATATVVGNPSFGEFSDATDWVLPNGTELTISMEIYTDLDGVNHEAIGVPVDLSVPFDEAIPAAVEHFAETS